MNSFSRADIEPNDIVYFLKKDLRLKEVCQKILYQQIISQAAQERGVTVTPEEIQAEADRVRYEMRLEKASETLAWLADQMITADDWETGIRDRLLKKKLADFLFAKDVEKIFAQSKLDYEQVVLYQIIVPYEPLARELMYQIEEEELSFYEVAHLYDIDPKRRHNCGYEGKLYRQNLKPNIAAIIFGAPIGELVGPIQTEQGYHLLKVEEFIPAELTPERSQSIINRMFKEWLENELNYMIHNQPD
jgi:parvulin-like peptidyl-prolyl isomerase